MAGLSPAQVSAASAQDQQMFGQILNAIQNQQQLKLGSRKQTLAEQKFGAVQKAETTGRESIERLRSLTVDTINQASVADLATINKASIGTLLTLNAKLRAGQNVTKSDSPREVKLLTAMREDPKAIAAGGDITQSDLWQVVTTGKNRAKSDQELKQAILANLTKGFIINRNTTKDETKKLVNDQLAIIKGETEKTGDPLLDSVFEDINQEKRTRLLDEVFISHEPTR